MNKRATLQHVEFLRGMAIVWVVLFHAFPKKVDMGYLGVDVFLVISGYFLFCKPLNFAEEGTLYKVCLKFIKKKFKRILIPLSISVLASLLACSFFQISEDLVQTCWTSIWALFCSTNLYLDYISSDYFSPNLNFDPLVPTWYLSVICQIYLLFLIGSILLFKIRKQYSLIILTCIGIVSFSGSCSSILNHAFSIMGGEPIVSFGFGYYSTFGRLWEVLLGGAILLLPSTENKKSSVVLGLLGLALIVLPCMTDGASGKNIKMLMVVVGTMMSIKYGAYFGTRNVFNLPLQWLGKISFSVYLLHMLIIVLAWSTVGCDSAVGFLGLISTIILASWIMYICVESRNMMSAKWGVTWCFALAMALFLLVFNPVSYVLSEDSPKYTKYDTWLIPKQDDLNSGFDNEIIQPSGEINRISAGNPPNADILLLGDGTRQRKISFVLMGDSHAAAMFFGLSEYCCRKDINGIYLNTYVVPHHHHLRKGIKRQRWDDEKENALLHWFECHPELDTIILAQRWSLPLSGKSTYSVPGYNAPDEHSLRLFLQQLKHLRKKVIIITPVPEFKASLLKRSYVLYKNRGMDAQGDLLVCTKDAYDKRMAIPMASLETLENEGLCQLLHIEHFLFTDGKFASYENGEWLMMDGNHLSPEGSRKVIRGCQESLDALLHMNE